MPVRSRSADDPPRHTPSFVCEVPLRVSRTQERTLLARLEAARQVYNACLGQARRRVRLVRQSKAFQRARMLPRDDPARKALFAQARSQHAFSEYALHAYAQQFGQSWLGEHLDSLTIQKLASRAYAAANQATAGEGQTGALQRETSTRQRSRQDYHQRHPLVRGSGGMERAGGAGAPGPT